MARCAGQRRSAAWCPLHGNRVWAWLGKRMTRLAAVIVEAVAFEHEYAGRSVFGWESLPSASGHGAEANSCAARNSVISCTRLENSRARSRH